jgi:hypothetical protein
MLSAMGSDNSSQPMSHDVLMDTFALPGGQSIDDMRRRITHALPQAASPPMRQRGPRAR